MSLILTHTPRTVLSQIRVNVTAMSKTTGVGLLRNKYFPDFEENRPQPERGSATLALWLCSHDLSSRVCPQHCAACTSIIPSLLITFHNGGWLAALRSGPRHLQYEVYFNPLFSLPQ